jgi:hypothetical protein
MVKREEKMGAAGETADEERAKKLLKYILEKLDGNTYEKLMAACYCKGYLEGKYEYESGWR